LRLHFILGATALCLPGRAVAHAFQGGAEPYAQFVEGAGVILAYPGILLPVLAMGVAISLWQTEGLPRVWPFALAGQVVGVFAAVLAGPWIAMAVMALGVCTAVLAALWPESRRGVITAFCFLSGLGAVSVALEGHGLFELSVFIQLGILFGVNLVLAVGAGAAALTLERVPAAWMQIGWRVVSSWIAAILLLVLAFTIRGGVS
jgi:hypothetical protein